MNKLLIEGVQVNLDQLALENESLDQLKTKDIFPEGPAQEKSYEELWKAVEPIRANPPEIKIAVEKVSKKKRAVV